MQLIIGVLFVSLPGNPSQRDADQKRSGETLFDTRLTCQEIGRRFREGSRVREIAADGGLPPGNDLLFVLGRDGQLAPATSRAKPTARGGDTLIALGPALG